MRLKEYLNIDNNTLHILTAPIHAIDALTGWHIWANVKSDIMDLTVKVKIKEYIESIKRIFNINALS
jgi:hypothetical protein